LLCGWRPNIQDFIKVGNARSSHALHECRLPLALVRCRFHHAL
jgi:hypothetical protein